MSIAGQQPRPDHVALVLEPNAATRAAITEAFESLGVRACVAADPVSCFERLNQSTTATGVSTSDPVLAVVASYDDATVTKPALLDLIKDRVFAPPIVVTVLDSLEPARSGLLSRSVWGQLPKPTSQAAARPLLADLVEEGRRRLRDRLLVQGYRQREANLNQAERLVLQAVCEGKLNKQIAREMNVSVRTVEQRRRRVFSTMGVASAAPLAELHATVVTLERAHAPRRVASAPIALPSIATAMMTMV